MLSTTSFYFITSKKGYAFFFKNYVEENAKVWYEYLKILQEKHDLKKQKVKETILTDKEVKI